MQEKEEKLNKIRTKNQIYSKGDKKKRTLLMEDTSEFEDDFILQLDRECVTFAKNISI